MAFKILALQETGDVVKQRLEGNSRTVKENCDAVRPFYVLRNDENSVKDNLIIDRKHNLVYCSVEKIGSTFWRRVFQLLGDDGRNDSDPFSIKEVDAFKGYETSKGLTFDEIYRILQGSKKFMFAREPFERLFSGYVDKLYAPNSMYWNYIGRYVIENFRNDASNFSLQCGHDVTFAEFVRYFVHSQEKENVRRDPHFVSTYEHCRPCEIQYDYVGKLETFKDDALGILEIHNLRSSVSFSDYHEEKERDAITSTLDWLFRMKYDIVKCMSITRAVFRAWRKLQIRGIINKKVEFPFSMNSSADLAEKEVTAAFLKAHDDSGSASERKQNREEAFSEAFSEIPQELLDRLKNALFVDSTLFGYEVIPSKILKMKSSPGKMFDFKYFDLTS